MKLYPLLIIFFLLTFGNSAYALQLEASAYGKSIEQARKKALAALSESIFVDVKSTFTSESKNDGSYTANNIIESTSNLPLLGVGFIVVDKAKEKYCTATLSSEKSLKLYKAKLDQLSSSISKADKKQQSLANDKSRRYQVLSELLTEIEQYSKYRAVALYLGNDSIPILSIAPQDIRSELLSIETAAPSLDIAAGMLTRDLPSHSYFVQPPLPQGSKRATELSRILMDKISTRISSVEDVNRSEYTLKGSYEILDDGLSVTYRAINNNGLILATRIVKLSEQAYKNIDYKPVAIDFDHLLHEGYVVSNAFRADLSTSNGKSDLLFLSGDTVQLFSKLNHPGYLYVVAHNTKDDASYVLELNNANGNRAFVRYVNADDANRWVSLGEFEVAPPYGVESLQLIASSRDLIDKVPATKYDNETGLYFVKAASASEAVHLTRGLKPRKSSGTKTSEATLTFTTMEKNNQVGIEVK